MSELKSEAQAMCERLLSCQIEYCEHLPIGYGPPYNPDGPDAAALIQKLLAEREILREALEFYADPETYHACSFLFDRPTGGFDEDFDEEHGHEDYDRPMPGRRARSALSDGLQAGA